MSVRPKEENEVENYKQVDGGRTWKRQVVDEFERWFE